MFEIMVQLFLGWPAMLVSLALTIAGIAFKKWEFVCAAAILLLPPAWYLSHYSLIYAILPLLLFGAAYAVSRDKVTRAAILTVPVFIAIVGLGIVVLTQ